MAATGRKAALATGIVALGILGAAAHAFRDHLLSPWHRQILLRGDREASFRAAGKLAAIGAVEAIPDILEAYAGKDPCSEGNAYTKAVQRFLDLDPRRTVRLLALGLVALHPRVRLQAAFILDGFCDVDGPDGLPMARFAAPELTAALDDPDDNVRGFCTRTLGRIGPSAGEAAVERLRRVVLENRNEDERNLAREALERMMAPELGPAHPE